MWAQWASTGACWRVLIRGAGAAGVAQHEWPLHLEELGTMAHTVHVRLPSEKQSWLLDPGQCLLRAFILPVACVLIGLPDSAWLPFFKNRLAWILWFLGKALLLRPSLSDFLREKACFHFSSFFHEFKNWSGLLYNWHMVRSGNELSNYVKQRSWEFYTGNGNITGRHSGCSHNSLGLGKFGSNNRESLFWNQGLYYFKNSGK